MTQPEALKSTGFLPWARARGTDVWTMFRAAIDGDLASIRSLVERDPNLVECEFEYRKPLHFAVRENRREVAEFLLEKAPIRRTHPDPVGTNRRSPSRVTVITAT